jgi:hypothetical protein
MFDLDCQEDSIADILNNKGISTYTFDIAGSGPDTKPTFVGNCHEQNVEFALSMVKEHGIDHVFAYSYGAIVAGTLSRLTPIKTTILLDPFANIQGSKVAIEGSGLVELTLSGVEEDMRKYNVNIKQEIVDAHLASLTTGEKLVTASYPTGISKEAFRIYKEQSVPRAIANRTQLHTYLTKTPGPVVGQLFSAGTVTRNTDWSHWILLEDGRYWLADEIERLIT